VKPKIGFVGLGLMGKGRAINLIDHGFPIYVLAHKNRQPVEELKKMGAEEVTTPKELAEKVEVVFLVVPGSSQVEEVVLGSEGIRKAQKPGLIVIDSSTSYPFSTRRVAAKLKEVGMKMLDAPLIGGPKEARSGQLRMVVGGDRTIYEKCQPLWKILAKQTFYVGKVGTGHTLKVLNNLLAAINIAAMSEVLPLVVKCGIDPQDFFQVVSSSAANSQVFQHYVPQILQRDFSVSFRLEMAYKDVSYAVSMARDCQAPLLMGNAALQLYEIAKSLGLGKEDIISVIKACEQLAHVEVKS